MPRRTYQGELKGIIIVIRVLSCQTKIYIEISSKGQIRAIGKILLLKIGLKPYSYSIRGFENWPLFVNKQQFQWSASIKLNNNNNVFIDF